MTAQSAMQGHFARSCRRTRSRSTSAGPRPDGEDTMLHEDTLMLDIDVDHWRNLQTLLLDSAKDRRRIVVIHEDGEVLKLVHSSRAAITGTVERADDPHAVAEHLYRDNAE